MPWDWPNGKNHKSNQMSGGQQQRVAIARALVNDPVIILADEATGNLDTRTSFEILVLFQELHDRGRTIIFVTHNPELSAYSSRNIVLRDGKIIQRHPQRPSGLGPGDAEKTTGRKRLRNKRL